MPVQPGGLDVRVLPGDNHSNAFHGEQAFACAQIALFPHLQHVPPGADAWPEGLKELHRVFLAAAVQRRETPGLLSTVSPLSDDERDARDRNPDMPVPLLCVLLVDWSKTVLLLPRSWSSIYLRGITTLNAQAANLLVGTIIIPRKCLFPKLLEIPMNYPFCPHNKPAYNLYSLFLLRRGKKALPTQCHVNVLFGEGGREAGVG